MPVLYLVLLRAAKKAIIEDQPTALSRALNFLHKDFEPKCYYWEVVEVMKKIILVGFASIILRGTQCATTAANDAPSATFTTASALHPHHQVPDLVRLHGDTGPQYPLRLESQTSA